jgi:hypothetical protein
VRFFSVIQRPSRRFGFVGAARTCNCPQVGGYRQQQQPPVRCKELAVSGKRKRRINRAIIE